MVVVPGQPGLLRGRHCPGPGAGPAATGRGAHRGRRVGDGLSQLCRHRAGAERAATGQPDRLAVRRLRPGLVPGPSRRGGLGRPAGPQRPPPAPDRTALCRLGAGVGPRDRPWRHPAAAAAPRRTAALGPLAASRLGQRDRGHPVAGRRPGAKTADHRANREPVRAGRGGRHRRQPGRGRRPTAVSGQLGGGPDLCGAAVPGLAGGGAPAAALGRRRGHRRRGRAGRRRRAAGARAVVWRRTGAAWVAVVLALPAYRSRWRYCAIGCGSWTG